MRTPRRALLLTAALTTSGLALSACSSTSPGGSDSDGLTVLASFYPLQYIAEQVGGEYVSVSSLTPPGAEPHDLELSPSQVDQLGSADLVVYLSDFQASVDQAVDANPPSQVVDAAKDVTLHAADHDDHAEEEDEEEHDHGSADPHFWLNPTLLPSVADDVAAALGEIDPEHAQEFTANATTFADSMTDLDQRYTEGLATCTDRTIVTTHEAFSYLAEQYDLTQVGISGVDPEAEPSPARLREISDLVESEGVSTIFFETLASPKVAETLASELGVQTAVLDPLEGLTDDTQDYLSVADANLEALRTALSCS
ncbi:metal ABC transporter substrate-binding protein [Cellulomonas sp. NPDC089187]|uniref:metal ABC transporter substrate-binding protein n=1 Tax=Cellulomonas sp. NPDC089187 TaxID=3154970 RepID=UPI00343A8CB8